MKWHDFLRDIAATLGITSFFAVVASGFLLKAREKKVTITVGSAILTILAGQMVQAVATCVAFRYFGWSEFFAPLIGVLSGLVGLFVIGATIGAGERIEDRGGDIGDAGIDIIAKRFGGKGIDK